jgi:hypothetical protein
MKYDFFKIQTFILKSITFRHKYEKRNFVFGDTLKKYSATTDKYGDENKKTN